MNYRTRPALSLPVGVQQGKVGFWLICPDAIAQSSGQKPPQQHITHITQIGLSPRSIMAARWSRRLYGGSIQACQLSACAPREAKLPAPNPLQRFTSKEKCTIWAPFLASRTRCAASFAEETM